MKFQSPSVARPGLLVEIDWREKKITQLNLQPTFGTTRTSSHDSKVVEFAAEAFAIGHALYLVIRINSSANKRAGSENPRGELQLASFFSA